MIEPGTGSVGGSMMVNDPWSISRSSTSGEEPIEQTAAPTTWDPWATQEQPTLSAAPVVESFAPPAAHSADPLGASASSFAPVPRPEPAMPTAESEPPVDFATLAQELADSAPSRLGLDSGAATASAVPVVPAGWGSDLEQSASDSTVLVGRHGPYEFIVRLADGLAHPIDRPTLFGRRPDPEQGPTGVRLVSIDDPQRTVSRSHLLVQSSEAGILLRNLSTVNALVLIGPDGSEAEVGPGGAITVTDACRVILGAYPIAVERA